MHNTLQIIFHIVFYSLVVGTGLLLVFTLGSLIIGDFRYAAIYALYALAGGVLLIISGWLSSVNDSLGEGDDHE